MPPRSRGSNLSLLHRAFLPFNASIAQRTSLCAACHRASPAPFPAAAPIGSSSRLTQAARPFTTSPALRKSKKSSSKASPAAPSSPTPPQSKKSGNKDVDLDPNDFSALDAGIATSVGRLKDALAKTRDAGRVSSEMIESLTVELSSTPKDGQAASKDKTRTRVGDIASVVPKGGRMMQVYCGDEAHVKPVTSALLSSPYSLVPAPDGQNPLLLLVPVPPATAETRAAAAVEAKKVMERASSDIRDARGVAQKRFRKMELGKLVVADELHKAHKAMEEVVRKGQEEVKRVYEGALKSLER